MPFFTQIVIALAAVVVIAEFYLVLRNQRDRRILQKLNSHKEQ